MKLSMLPLVTQTIAVRKRITESLAAIEIGLFNVTIRGEYQDDAMAALIKPVVVTELVGRLASIDRDLLAYGVKVDTSA